jgi:hypothetical protein
MKWSCMPVLTNILCFTIRKDTALHVSIQLLFECAMGRAHDLYTASKKDKKEVTDSYDKSLLCGAAPRPPASA